MSRELLRRAIVYDDLLGMADFIARDDPAAAIRFLDAAEETFRFLSESPDVGNACELVHPELADMWYWHVRGFRKHLIFYFANETEIEIVRVLHAARDWGSLLRR